MRTHASNNQNSGEGVSGKRPSEILAELENGKDVLLLGRTGSGKSRFVRDIVRDFDGKVLVVDPCFDASYGALREELGEERFRQVKVADPGEESVARAMEEVRLLFRDGVEKVVLSFPLLKWTKEEVSGMEEAAADLVGGFSSFTEGEKSVVGLDGGEITVILSHLEPKDPNRASILATAQDFPKKGKGGDFPSATDPVVFEIKKTERQGEPSCIKREDLSGDGSEK